MIEQVPEGPSDRYLLPGPALPLSVPGGDGTATFDGEWIRIEWNWMAEEVKKSAGPQRFALKDLIGLEWIPNAAPGERPPPVPPQRLRTQAGPQAPNPHCLVLWGMDKADPHDRVLVTAVFVRLPHPSARLRTPASLLERPHRRPPPETTRPGTCSCAACASSATCTGTAS